MAERASARYGRARQSRRGTLAGYRLIDAETVEVPITVTR
jgi:hypothetical protein